MKLPPKLGTGTACSHHETTNQAAAAIVNCCDIRLMYKSVCTSQTPLRLVCFVAPTCADTLAGKSVRRHHNCDVSVLFVRMRFPQSGAAIEDARAVQYVGQLVSAVEFIHHRMIIHRDIKPANILLRDGEFQVNSKLCVPVLWWVGVVAAGVPVLYIVLEK